MFIFHRCPHSLLAKTTIKYEYDSRDPTDTHIKSETLETENLTQHPLDKMATILQTVFSDAFLWVKSSVFWLKCHWSFPQDSNWQ